MRVAVLGAGYAGLGVARRLARRLSDEVELVVVDDTGEHLVQHELHRIVRRPGLAEEIAVPLEAAVDATVREARVESVDADGGVVECGDGTVEYDLGVLALGAETADYDIPGVEAHGLPLKRLDHARAIRASYLDSLAADAETVVGGAGLSGVQVAGELAALAREEGQDPAVTLVEQADRVAPTFPERFGTALRAELEDAGVAVRTGVTVESADADAVATDAGEFPADTFVWTGGIRGPDALRGDRPVVDRTLRLGRVTFGAGDAVRVVDADGQTVPAAAQTAIRQAPVVAENVARLAEHRRTGGGGFEPRLESYTYESPGWLASVGDGAVAQVGPTVFRGRAAIALKTTVGAGYLSGVGAVRQAVGLVEEELGLAPDDAASIPFEDDRD